jgi:hypothetical protein
MTKWCIDLLRKFDVQIAGSTTPTAGRAFRKTGLLLKFDRKSALAQR